MIAGSGGDGKHRPYQHVLVGADLASALLEQVPSGAYVFARIVAR